MELIGRDDTLSKYFLYSAVAHVAVVFALMIKAYVYPGEPIELVAALRVDMVDLPDKIVDTVPDIPAPKEPVVAPPEPPQATPAPVKIEEKTEGLQKKQNDALSKLKQDSALEKIQKELERENKKKPPPAPTTYKGNQIAAGTELRGLARAQHDQYVGSLERLIRANWALPEWLSNKNLKAQVRVKVNSKGEIVDIRLVKPSGNLSFDENVMVTVQKSSPLPPPPERLELILRNEGIVLGFPE